MKFLSLLAVGISLINSGPALCADTILSGKLVLAKNRTAQAKGIRTVFLTLQDPASESRMPCAAEKFTLTKDASGEFYTFELTTDTLKMMGCPTVPEKFNVKAKLDKDDSANPDAPGDIIGVLKGVKKGSKNIVIDLKDAA